MRYYVKVGLQDLDNRSAQAMVEASLDAASETAAKDAAVDLAIEAITARHGHADRRAEAILCREDDTSAVASIVWSDMKDRRR
jgi:hypothetical protein